MFAGIDNKARKSTGAYIGVDGVARRAKKLYMGVAGKARLCWEADGGESDRVRAYLYNGVKLPQLPDKGMPYALMELDENEKYHVWLCNAPIHTSNIGVLLVPSGSAGYHYIVSDDGAAWELHEEWGMADSTYDSPFAWPNNAVWADYDVLEKDGITVRLAASNPVPLYSYNGVELPELPGAVKDYRYIWVRRIPLYILKKAYWVLAQNTISYSVSDTGAECINVPASSLRYRYYVETDPSDWVIAPIEDDGDDRIATKGWLVWSNFQMLDTTDTIIMAASAPQPVYL